MAIATFAAIDVGSSELSMKLFEVSKRIGITEIVHLRHRLLLGAETYKTGTISYDSLSELCAVLKNFSEIMKEYQVDAYSAYATSAVREAENTLVVLDQIKLQSGLKVRVLSNSEQRFLRYKAIALKEARFNELISEGTIIVDIGAGSAQFSVFVDSHLLFTQNLKLGFARIHELLNSLEPEAFSYQELISEYMEKDLIALCEIYLKNVKTKHIIAVGDRIHELKHLIMEKDTGFDGFLTAKEFDKLKPPAERALYLLPITLLYKKMLTLTECNSIYLSDIDLCDSIVAEYAEKKEKMMPVHNFTEDIISASKNLAKKYNVSMSHIDNVGYLATEIFDRIRKLHGLGKRERLLLEIGVILHGCGSFVNINQTRENSYKIIMSTEIIGLSHLERVMIANMVRYNTDRFPKYEALADELDKESYIKTVKLCAILKIANVLDKSNRQKIKKVRITRKENELLIVADTIQDITLEQGLFYRKADIFEEVFGIRPKLKQKRSVGNGKI